MKGHHHVSASSGEAASIRSHRTPAGKKYLAAGLLLLASSFLLATPLLLKAASPSPSFTIMDARERGIFNTGSAQANIIRSHDETLDKDVLGLKYTAPEKTSLGLWAKSFPPEFTAEAVNAVSLGVKVTDAEQLGRIAVNFEIKGTRSTQKIPVVLTLGWASLREEIDWDAVGDLKEAVFTVTPEAEGETVSGKIFIDLAFVKADLPKKAGTKAAGTFTVLDARASGVFNIGASVGSVGKTYDAAVRKDVLEFSYAAPKSTVIGVWTKDYPARLGADAVNAVKIGVKTTQSGQARQIAVALEIKGTKNTQTIPLSLKSGWTSATEAIDWELIGALKEAVFTVKPMGPDKASGKLRLDLVFVKADLPAQAASSGTPGTFTILDARGSGVFNIGKSEGTVTKTFDESLKKDVLEFVYAIPKDTVIGVWTKNYPPRLGPDTVNAVAIAVKVPQPEQINDITAALELKGTKGTQSMPLTLKPGWNNVQQPIDWNSVGTLQEAVFAFKPAGTKKRVSGTLSLDLTFIKADLPQTDAASAGTYGILDARASGVFNIGSAQGTAGRTYDEAAKKDVLKFQYSAPRKTAIGLWTKDYPAGLNASAADSVRIGVKTLDPAQVNQVTVNLEIKGAKGTQNVKLKLIPGWSALLEPVNWNTIGALREIVFVVHPATAGEDDGPAAGTLYFDLAFGKLTFVQKYGVLIKTGLAVCAGVPLALGAWLFGLAGGRRKARQLKSAVQASGLSLLKYDLLYGVTAVLIGGTGLFIYSLGKIDALNAPFSLVFLFAALLGAATAGLLKLSLTGRHLTPSETFQDALVSGFLAVSSSSLPLLQAPAGWMQVLLSNNLTATLAFVIYHAANANSLAVSRKHLSAISAALIALTPSLFGWLLLMENGNLLRIFGNGVTAGFLSSWPAVQMTLGKLFVIFVFNEAVTNGISLAAQGKLVDTKKAHLVTFLISLGVVIAPLIANLGSTPAVGSLPVALMSVVAVITAMASQAGFWGEVYLITGVFLDGIQRAAPTEKTISSHITTGMKKGMAYSGILMALLYAVKILLSFSPMQSAMSALPLVTGIVLGALTFPLVTTLVETFDGSQPFFDRLRYSYRNAVLYARGAVVGFGFAGMITQGLFQKDMSDRIVFGLIVGLAGSLGISLLRDATYALGGRGKLQSWRLYLVDSLLGVFVGSAAAFYLDSSQVPVVVEKIKLYTSAGFSPIDYTTYPLLNKWGRIDLGAYTGGVKLLFTESLAGVINWSIAAWLFAINRVFLEAYFNKDTTPIKFFFSRAGFTDLMRHMIYVLRWGLWMSPIIFTFLRMMPTATWYNQDGAIRTLFATFNSLTMSPENFQAWSLTVFVWVLAYDAFRILIWMDHMGLRVATLVNLSFIGMDKLDERVARFIGPAAAQRYIPEAVKRFTTWAPLLIPFYLPRGEAWDYAWGTAEAMQNSAQGGGFLLWVRSLSGPQMTLLLLSAVLVFTAVSFVIRALGRRSARLKAKTLELTNREYRVTVKDNGEMYSELYHKEYDVTRRSYDSIDPCGRILYLIDTEAQPETAGRAWPVTGNFPPESFTASRVEKCDDSITVVNASHGITATIDIRLPDQDSPAELWAVTLENTSDKPRKLKAAPYLEWVLNRPMDDRFHTQYARLYPEMQYVDKANAVLSWQKNTKSMGILASDVRPEGFLTSRVDFIGRARSIWSPRAAETLSYLPSRDTSPYPTFDPIGSLLLDVTLGPKESRTVHLLIGCAKNKAKALELIEKHLKPQSAPHTQVKETKRPLLIGHGEIPPGTPQPYFEYSKDGNKLLVHTPCTPRPYDHAMSNAMHSVMVTNRGLHTSCNGNSQQNRLTPDWADTVTKEVPSEAIYLYDPDSSEWFSPTHHPLNDFSAKNEAEFGVDGTAVFRMTRGTLSTELTVFVPTDEPAGVYLLTIKNDSDRSRHLRVAPYFQMALSLSPERSGPLVTRYDKALNALFFENPRNLFRSGPAFASLSIAADRVETKRGRFFGTGRGIRHPFLVERGVPDTTQITDNARIAAFVGGIEVPAHGERTVAVVLGQADTKKSAVEIVKKYKNVETALASLENTRQWWLNLMKTVEVATSDPDFDHYQNWLKYQALAERIWARRGFYQTSGAFGFRDQLQDTVNLIWVDPALARKQILLHASQQFTEGDVFHWFFTLTDGRTSFACRSHASDNLLWLAWGAVEYVKATGDESLMDERASYVTAKNPFMPLPRNKQGLGDFYPRSTLSDTVYRHCMKSIDLVLDKRMGRNGLPLMGTGDWNDGLDDIGCEGRGESVWLGFFLYYILRDMLPLIEKKDGAGSRAKYEQKMKELAAALEKTWRDDRYLRAIHDDGTEIGIKGSGIWEIDTLTAAWAVMAGINPERSLTVFNTALNVLEKDNAILLGWPALREDTKPYLGRSCKYPEGVRENGMYCHGVQWLVRAARILAEQFESSGNRAGADEYRAIAYRLWLKVSPIPHMSPEEIEIYGGQPNKQAADFLTNFECGRMIWHGYTGAAGWMLRQAMEGVIGATLSNNEVVLPGDLDKPRGTLRVLRVRRDLAPSPLKETR